MLKIYCQGEIIPQDQARISASDHGFLYGATLFETFRTYGGEPFLLEEHIARLRAGCRSYGIQPSDGLLITQPPDYPKLRNLLRRLLAENHLADAVFRYTLSAGEAPTGFPSQPFTNPTEIIFVRPPPPPPHEKTIGIHILNTIRTEPEVFPRPKSGHYMNSLAGLRELHSRTISPGDEGLLLTRDGLLSEGITSNVFLVSGRSLRTPSSRAHILGGVTRNHLLAHAASHGVEAREENLTLSDLTAADAIFITNSVRGILPVDRAFDHLGEMIWQKASAQNPTVQKLVTALAPSLPASH